MMQKEKGKIVSINRKNNSKNFIMILLSNIKQFHEKHT